MTLDGLMATPLNTQDRPAVLHTHINKMCHNHIGSFLALPLSLGYSLNLDYHEENATETELEREESKSHVPRTAGSEQRVLAASYIPVDRSINRSIDQSLAGSLVRQQVVRW